MEAARPGCAAGQLGARSRDAAVLRCWCWSAGGLAALVALRLAARKLLESFDETARAKAAARRKLEQAGSFAAWSAAARELDALSGLSQQEQLARWRRETRLYDRRLLATRLRHLREVRERGDVEEMAFAVRADLLRNLANVTSPCASSPEPHWGDLPGFPAVGMWHAAPASNGLILSCLA